METILVFSFNFSLITKCLCQLSYRFFDRIKKYDKEFSKILFQGVFVKNWNWISEKLKPYLREQQIILVEPSKKYFFELFLEIGITNYILNYFNKI